MIKIPKYRQFYLDYLILTENKYFMIINEINFGVIDKTSKYAINVTVNETVKT